MEARLIPDYLKHWADKRSDEVWLRELKGGEEARTWTWSAAQKEVNCVAAALEQRFGHTSNMAILSNNRPHWILADNAIIASGNVTVTLFTTLNPSTVKYITDFTETSVLFLGAAEAWEEAKKLIAPSTVIVSFPGVELAGEHLKWDDLVAEGRGQTPQFTGKPDDLVSLVFTSGTTGTPKGVMQTHDSCMRPMLRGMGHLNLGEHPQFFSYLPLSHIAERLLVEYASMISGGIINFNENLSTLVEDLKATQPAFFFGPPRVWEQVQQKIIAKLGSQKALDEALASDKKAVGELIVAGLGLDKVRYCLTAAAPTPPALIHWYADLGLTLLEGFGQTEAMTLILSTAEMNRIGSIGKAIDGVECKLTEDGELVVRAEACTPGYYKDQEKTDELYKDGWLHTGDKARIDEDGFIYITGRVKDYFKTIQGKFVAPTPIENLFSKNIYTEQQCLIGRGFSKTVMTCVLAESASSADASQIEQDLKDLVVSINAEVESHARIGAVIISKEAWSIINEMLTPTMKIKREQVENRFGELGQKMATQSAETKEVLVAWL